MRIVHIVLILALAVLIVSPALAEKPVVRKPVPSPAAQFVERMVQGLDLTAEQKDKLKEIAKKCGPEFVAIYKKQREVLTPEQIKAEKEARQEAKAAGKTPKEAEAAVAAALKLTDEQKAKMAEIRNERGALEKELRSEVMNVLTDEQKAELKKRIKPKPKTP